ncbi:MAG: radical SAM protein [bacterium]
MKFFGFQWHITNFCNLRCCHCYQDDFTHTGELPFIEVIKIVDRITQELREYQIGINVTGGEPLLRADIYDILKYLDIKDNIKTINIITNGLFLDKKAMEKLNEFRKLKELKISLEGGDAETNDRIRGKGTFDRVVNSIKSIHNISKKELVLMFTLGSYNYKNLSAMLKLASELGVDGMIIERFVPWGNGGLLKDHYLKRYEWQDVITEIIRFTDLDFSPAELLPYKAFHIVFDKSTELKGAMCNLGDESMALMPNGDVYPCRRLPTKIGNIIKDEFKEIRLRLKILYESLKKEMKGKCQGCSIENCMGCRAIAYALTGDFYAEDPQCFL